ncbi:MAG: hypothetical protein J0I09_00090, partial [Sphingobacteriia bacterium]|nr:hypothetical protein [Sphingobacteriia bacterium]
MDIKYFNLFDGSLEFHSDKIIIFDKAKRNRIFLLVGVISGLIYSTTTLLRGYRQNDNLLILFGLILTISWTITSILRRKEFQK